MTTANATPRIHRHRLLPMVGRDPRERHRSASPLELLYDLTFVVSFGAAGDQLAHYVAEGHLATALWGFGFVLLWVCWAWINYTFFSSAFDTDDWLHRILTMVQMVGVLVIALGIPDVFHSIDAGEAFDFRIFTAGYIVMRLSAVLMWVRVALRDPSNRRTAVIYIVFISVAQACWAAVSFSRIEAVPLLLGLMAVLTIVEFAGPVVATWDSRVSPNEWRGTPWNAHHIVERYGLLVIITLGEGILGTIAAVSALVGESGWTGEAILIVVAGVGITFGIWWSYFVVPSGAILARHRNRKWTWGYGHIVLFGAVAAVGAGMHVAAYAAEGDIAIGTLGVVLAVAVPVLVFCVAYFVLYSILFRAVDGFHLILAAGMIAFLVLGVVLAAVGVPLGWCLLAVTLSPFVVVVGYETVGHRHVAADVDREG